MWSSFPEVGSAPLAERHSCPSSQQTCTVRPLYAELTVVSKYGTAIGALGGAAMQFGVILPYSREHEYEADRLGVDFMVGSGYDPRQAVDFWIGMAAMNDHHSAEFASTHPSDDNRVAAMRAHIQARGYTG